MNMQLLEKYLFVDGGVVSRNPSTIGGTMAWRHIVNRQVTAQGTAIITPADAELPAITNNLTEMLALVIGFEELPGDWIGTVCSDSQVTLGRAFMGWRWKNVPMWLVHRFQEQRARLVHYEQIKFILLDGHPTKAQLLSGVGKRGHPVSEHNVWCDEACGENGQVLAGRTA